MEAAKAFEVATSRVCLIYAGKILKDEHTLIEHKLKDGLTVHIVIKVCDFIEVNASYNSKNLRLPINPRRPLLCQLQHLPQLDRVQILVRFPLLLPKSLETPTDQVISLSICGN